MEHRLHFRSVQSARREMGNTFAAAYIGSAQVRHAGEKTVVPDHKLYFIPVESGRGGLPWPGFLNAPTIAKAVSAYAAQLNLGTSVAEYLNIPRSTRPMGRWLPSALSRGT